MTNRCQWTGLGVIVLLVILFGVVVVRAGEAGSPRFRILVDESNAFVVTFGDLVAAGLEGPEASDGIGVSCQGESVPILVVDGGDGEFGPGDSLMFVGYALGQGGFSRSPWAAYNVYSLAFDVKGISRPTVYGKESTSAGCDGPELALHRDVHLEKDLRRVHLSRPRQTLYEWVWRPVSVVDPAPVVIDVGTDDLDAAATDEAVITVGLVGISRLADQRGGPGPDHLLEIGLGDRILATIEWDSRTADHPVELPPVDAGDLAAAEGRLWFHVPRRETEDGALVVDVVAVDWINIRYPRSSVIDRPGGVVEWHGAAADACLSVVSASPDPLWIFSDDGMIRTSGVAGAAEGGLFEHRVAGLPASGRAHVFERSGGVKPAAIVVDAPSDLSDPGNRADYVIIAHHRLIEAIQPLAELHRARGLVVKVVDVQDVYDEFSHGVVDPAAIRDLLGHARSVWGAPPPRFALLVGDACWDVRGVHETDPAGAARRALIPTWWIYNGGLVNASDAWFVAPALKDDGPVMAIGRLPASEPEEVAAVIDKVRNRLEKVDVGPWRRRALLIGDGLQPDLTLALRRQLAGFGLESEVIEPGGDRVAGGGHRGHLRDAIGAGHQIIHFAGHGSSIAWRTARADHAHGSDLFAREDIPLLEEKNGLPIVLAMTCASAPFDSPRIDSIGEQLLEAPGRGAVAVVAYSGLTARVNRHQSGILVKEMLTPGATVGEALFRAKRRSDRWDVIYTLNLLGDPALPVDLDDPGLEVVAEGAPPYVVSISDPSGGRAQTVWFGDGGETLSVVETALPTSAAVVEPDCPLAEDEVAAVGVYVWNDEAASDGLAGERLKEAPKRMAPIRGRKPGRRPGRTRPPAGGGPN